MAFDGGTTEGGMRLQFQIGRIEYDAARDITMVWPEDNFPYMGHIEIKGKISPEKCRNMFGEKVDGLFGKGYEDEKAGN